MSFESLHYVQMKISRKTIITHYSLIWINVDEKWFLLEQIEVKEAKVLLASLPKVLQPVL